ncbi:transposable element Tcb1 transposase [Trichonephila clavipes]|uniref:Transposable element Tcb1 transposase n=1 Tax=Trichonephila clavipes TaxID=2585209 RepID=A0A8X6UT55_TRICX|nr:transposable element Tcb1 transposase [Trichonephila clavipes]
MIGHIYRDVTLEQHVRLFRDAMSAEFLFMVDNARPHRANIVDECLKSENITRMDWPAYSQDLNPIEHVWDMLGRQIVARQPPPTCLPELRRALLDEWCNILQDQIDNLLQGEITLPTYFVGSAQVHPLAGNEHTLKRPAKLEEDPGSLLAIKCDHGSQTALARLTSDHMKCLSYDSGRKVPPLAKNAVAIQLLRITFWDT